MLILVVTEGVLGLQILERPFLDVLALPRRILGYLVTEDGLGLVDHHWRRFLGNFENRVRARFWFDIEPIVVDVPCLDHGASDGAGEGGKVDQLADRAAACSTHWRMSSAHLS